MTVKAISFISKVFQAKLSSQKHLRNPILNLKLHGQHVMKRDYIILIR